MPKSDVCDSRLSVARAARACATVGKGPMLASARTPAPTRCTLVTCTASTGTPSAAARVVRSVAWPVPLPVPVAVARPS